jgi:hypothetical protein
MIAGTQKLLECVRLGLGIVVGLFSLSVWLSLPAAADGFRKARIGILVPNLSACEDRNEKPSKVTVCQEHHEIVKDMITQLQGGFQTQPWKTIADVEFKEYSKWNLDDEEKIEEAKKFVADEKLLLLVRLKLGDRPWDGKTWRYEFYLYDTTDAPDQVEGWPAVGRYGEPLPGEITAGRATGAVRQLMRKITQEGQVKFGYKRIFVGCLKDRLSKHLDEAENRVIIAVVEEMTRDFSPDLAVKIQALHEDLAAIEGKVRYEVPLLSRDIWEQHCTGTDQPQFREEKERSFYYLEAKIIEDLQMSEGSGPRFAKIIIRIGGGYTLEGASTYFLVGEDYETTELKIDEIQRTYDDIPEDTAKWIANNWDEVVKDMNSKY